VAAIIIIIIIRRRRRRRRATNPVSKLTGYVLEDRGSIPGESGILLLTTASRQALGLIQPPIQR
jgi:hypothetical protein